MDLGFDSRDRPPVRFEVGPVLSLEDAVVSKVRTLIDREAARDFLDIYGLLAGGHFTAQQLVRLASEADPNVTSDSLATALDHSALPEPEDYAVYGLPLVEQERMHAALAAAAESLRVSAPASGPEGTDVAKPAPDPRDAGDRSGTRYPGATVRPPQSHDREM